MDAKDIFIVRPTNEEENDFIITVGNHLATPKHFGTRGEAAEYASEPKWDMIVALMAEMLEIKEKKEANIQMTNNFQEMEEKK